MQQLEIDGILNSIDEVEPCDNKVTEPLFIHNFGVFDLAIHSPSNFGVPASTVTAPEQIIGSPTRGFNDHSLGLIDELHASSYVPEASTEDTQFLTEPVHSSNDDDLFLHTGGNDLFMQCSEDDQPRQDKSQNVLPSDQHISPRSLTIPPTLQASYLPDTERFLMHHYMHRVVNLFCVIDNKKSPWKLIHLPKALQSIGELNIDGSSTRIRDALRSALLSISAFCLSNDGMLRQCDDDAARWAHQATRFRGRSIQLLKDAVEKDFHAATPPRYKEFLATMLSMITINVSVSIPATASR